ncbi:MAG: hypothetical protein A2283_07415 [Lentisphaerae bacterium RIFOXYA12_FULL_48_11]|nr:MAG: hypothetical protein A2283_07415 [Lentisphaerae bacterium RIFOXYA12_FULL_48_11]
MLRHFRVLLTGIVIYAVLSLTVFAGENQLQPGEESEVKMPDNGRMMKVYLPLNYSADKKWPVIFFFHGMNGSPTTAPIRYYTAGNDFVVIGLPYAAEKEVPKTAQQAEGILQKELANFYSARAWAGKNLKIDENRIIMGGISLGGWTTSTLAEYAMPRVAGMFILLAGRQREKTPPKNPALLKFMPVYIGAGEADPNIIPAFKAVASYRRYGAVVTYEIFMGLGHAPPQGAPPRFKAWLNSFGKWYAGTMTDDLRKEVDESLKGQLDNAMGKEDAQKYAVLLDLESDPSLSRSTPSVAAEISKQLNAARMESPGREESIAEKTFFELALQDVNMKLANELKAVRDGFKKLGYTYPETVFGKYAAAYAECLAQMYQKIMDASPSAMGAGAKKSSSVNFPTGESRARVPVIKYKKP